MEVQGKQSWLPKINFLKCGKSVKTDSSCSSRFRYLNKSQPEVRIAIPDTTFCGTRYFK